MGMPKHLTAIFIIMIVLVALFLSGILVLSSVFPRQIQTSNTNSTTNNTLPWLGSNSTTSNTTPNTFLNSAEPPPSFTGAVIVGITRPVAVLGKGGFSPLEISIKAGDSVTWRNDDPGRKRLVLIFQQGREQNKFFNSPALWPEEEWEHTFWEEGEYNYWSTAYGVEGKVMVLPCKNRFCPRKE